MYLFKFAQALKVPRSLVQYFVTQCLTEDSYPWSRHDTNYKKKSPKIPGNLLQDFLRLMQKCCDPVTGWSKLTISQQHELPKFISHGV